MGGGILLVLSRCCMFLRIALCLSRARWDVEQFEQKGNSLDRKKCAHQAPGLHPFTLEFLEVGERGVFVCWDCHNKLPQTVFLQQQTLIFSLFWRLEVQGEGPLGFLTLCSYGLSSLTPTRLIRIPDGLDWGRPQQPSFGMNISFKIPSLNAVTV